MLNAILSLFRMILLLLGGYEQIALENLALREQLAIFQRSVRHPKIRLMDRVFWVSRFPNVPFPDSCQNGAPRRPRRGEPSSIITPAISCRSTSSRYRLLDCACFLYSLCCRMNDAESFTLM